MQAPKGWSWAVNVLAVAFAFHAPLTANAQDAPVVMNPQPQITSQDPSGRVARLSSMEGSVTFQPNGESDWVTAVINRPLVTGDSLWADEGSRAEVHVGSTALRLGANTSITLLDVSDRAAQIRLAQGSLIVKVRHTGSDESYEIDTPNVAFTVAQPGEYRIDVDDDGDKTDVAVWSGSGEATGGGSSYTISAGRHAAFDGTDRLNYAQGPLRDKDEFDTWAISRAQTEDQSDSANYVSQDMTGYEDLDAYGSWSNVDGYGMTWQPTGVEIGWAPYRFGHWAWVAPWGWTWVESEPWGFAPFHYGRWAYAGARWVWVPGPTGVRPVYAPALVVWMGGAGVGWFPLAPGEVFVPGYRVSRAYVNSVNLANTRVERTTVTNVYNSAILTHGAAMNEVNYANRGVNGGVTMVSHDAFVNARPVAGNLLSVSAKELAAAPVSHMAGVEPVRSSVVGAGEAPANRPPAAVANRPVVALRTPPTSQQLVRQAMSGRSVATAPVKSAAPSQDGSRAAGQESADGKPKPRVVWEAEGAPEPEKNSVPQVQGRNTRATQNARSSQPASQQTAQQRSRSQAKAANPVRRDEQPHKDEEQKTSNSNQPKPATQQPRKQSSPAPHQQIAAKK